MRLPRAGSAATLAAGILLSGCATAGSRSSPLAGEEDQEVKVFVTNLAFMDATVYSITNGGRRRLGQVTGKREAVFTFPLSFSSEMYMEIDLLAGPRCVTERFFVDPGDDLELVIQTENGGLSCFGP